MLRFIIGIFVVLHGLVHLLYLGQSQRLLELRPKMIWPDGSWAFSTLVGDKAARSLASVACALAAIVFVASGLGIFLGQVWWRPLALGAAALSAIIFVVFWDRKMQMLADNGGIGLLIDIVILVALLLLQWPAFEF